ncbi:trypsin-like peptidase domain-containing protein [Streptomyces sp. MNU76]|nr:trypsin-like peptidase domain-containing protein [Streptomyces sp. MNU76]MCC9707977.1 trypsin-like peptidase domain-containing protein [Streptomyces sp. MNU76]
MSTENEGTAVPPAPSAPPVPVDAPAASAPAPTHEPSAAPAEPTAPPRPLGRNRRRQRADDAAPAGPADGAAPARPADDPAAAARAGVHGRTRIRGEPRPGARRWIRPGARWRRLRTGTRRSGLPGRTRRVLGARRLLASPPPPAVPSYADNGAAAGAYGNAGAASGAGGAGGHGGPGDGGWGSSWQQTQQPAPKPAGNKRGGLIAAILVAALVAGGVGGGLGYTLAERNDNSTGSTTVSASQNGGDVKRAAGTVAAVASAALPSTVTIEASGNDGEGGTGTGFVFDKEGHIVTNNHVVAEAVDGGKVSVTFPNGKKYAAEVVGHAQGYDVAVIKLKNAPSNLQPLTLGDSDKVAVGDSTIAIGAPFGLSNTVTTGIISAKNRPVASSDGSSSSKASYMSALQTDASINPGNSGGPLLDARGNVIGINSAIQSASNGSFGSGQAGSIGLGFAIPINQAKNVAQQLIRTGEPVYPVIGASVSLDEGTGGAKITNAGDGGSDSITAGGPADKAGLKPGDVITKLDDHVIDSGPTLIGEIWTHLPGDKVTLTYTRDGKTHTADVTLGEREGDS